MTTLLLAFMNFLLNLLTTTLQDCFLKKIRWNGRIVCPVCGSTHITTRGGSRIGIYRCNDCKKEFSVRTNSVMEHSNISLNKWLLAMYVFVTKRNGISSLELSKEISVTQKSAWYLLHRIRLAAGNGDALLKGIIEADETYIGGKEKHKHSIKKSHAGRGAAGKTPVFGMIERNGRVVMKVVDNTKAETLFSLFKKHVKSESEIITDEFTSYDNLAKFGYDHERVNHSAGKYVDGEVHTNTIESVWSNLKEVFMAHISLFQLSIYRNMLMRLLSDLMKATAKLRQSRELKHLSQRCLELLPDMML